MIKRFYCIVLLVLNVSVNAAEINNDSIANHIFTLIYEQDLTKAEQVFSAEKGQLNQFYQLYLNLDLHWWKYRTTYSRESSKALDDLIQNSTLENTESYEQKMLQIMVKSYELRFAKKKFRLFDLLSARSDIRDLIQEIEKEKPGFTGDQQKLFETFVIMYQYIENINFFANAKKSAEREKKLQRMEKFADEENVILNTVAHFFLARMYQKIEDKPQISLQHYKILTAKFPTHQVFAEYMEECEKELE